jgi:hypothetical protein
MRAFAIVCCGLLATAVQADDDKNSSSKSRASKKPATRISTYVPPASIGAPRGRLSSGATRAVRLPGPTLYSLVPEHTGQTISDQPSLFWYVDTLPPENMPVVFTLTNESEIDPVAEVELERLSDVGIQRLDLAHHKIHLEPGTEYEWTIAVVVDSKHRANDVVTTGWVMVVDEPPGLEPNARSYAANGLWYDALAAASDDLRHELLREVGLEEILGGPIVD